jgi:hypothetical protein
MAKGETRMLFVRDTQMLLVRVPIMIAGLLVAGLPGVVVGRVFTGLCSAIVNMVLVRRLIGLPVMRQLQANLRALASVAIMAAGVAFAAGELPQTADRPMLALQLATLTVLGGFIYCVTTFLLWEVLGRPEGPEREVQRVLGKLLTKLRPVRGQA